MNRLIAFVTTVVFLAAVLFRLGWTDRVSLIVTGVSLAAAFLIGWIIQSSVTTANDTAAVSNSDTPLAAIVFGLQLGVTLLLCCLVGFGMATLGGAWSRGKSKDSPSDRHSLIGPLAQVGPAAVHEPLTTRVVAIRYVQPIMFIDTQVLDDAERSVEALRADDFRVQVDGTVHQVRGVTTIPCESSLHVAVLRDASGSVRGKPYPELTVAATEAVRQALLSLPRPSSLRVANFSDTVTDVSAWSIDLKTATTEFLPATAKAEVSAIFASAAFVIEDLSHREGGRRLVLITDGGNNIPSDFSTAGLIAEARRKGVKIDVVALPTEHLQPSQRAFLEAIARQTGGVYVDAANPTSNRELAHALNADREVRAAYRLTIDCPHEVQPNVVTVDVRPRSNLPSVSTEKLVNRSATPEAL